MRISSFDIIGVKKAFLLLLAGSILSLLADGVFVWLYFYLGKNPWLLFPVLAASGACIYALYYAFYTAFFRWEKFLKVKGHAVQATFVGLSRDKKPYPIVSYSGSGNATIRGEMHCILFFKKDRWSPGEEVRCFLLDDGNFLGLEIKKNK